MERNTRAGLFLEPVLVMPKLAATNQLHATQPELRLRACPICQNSDQLLLRGTLPVTTAPKYSRSEFHYVECQQCSVIYISPLPTFDDFQAMYGNTNNLFRTPIYRDPQRINDREEYFKNRLLKILERTQRQRTARLNVLEIGAGLSWMCRTAKRLNSETRTTAQDVGSNVPEGCSGVDYYHLGSISDAIIQRRGPFDVISLSHVIEHLPDPVRDLQQLSNMLRRDGVIFITAPYRPTGWMPADDFVAAWKAYTLNHVPAHITYFSKNGMEKAASRSGLKLFFWQAGDASGAFEAWLARLVD